MKKLIWDEKENLLFHEWCDSSTTNQRRDRIYSKINGMLIQMSKATLRKNFKGFFNFSEEQNMIKTSVNDLLMRGIGYYSSDKLYHSFSFIFRFFINYWRNILYSHKNLPKNRWYNEKHTVVEDSLFVERHGYDSLFIQPEIDDNILTINDVLNRFNELINDIQLKIKENELKGYIHFINLNKKLIYLKMIYKYIEEFNDINIYNFNEYIFNNSDFSLNTLIWLSRQFFNMEGNFKTHKQTKDEFKNNMTR